MFLSEKVSKEWNTENSYETEIEIAQIATMLWKVIVEIQWAVVNK